MTRTEIEGWLVDWLSDEMGLSEGEIEKDRTLGSYGITTGQLVRLASEIEDFFEEPLEAGIIVKRSTLEKLIRELCILMDTDEEEFGAMEAADEATLVELGLQGVA